MKVGTRNKIVVVLITCATLYYAQDFHFQSKNMGFNFGANFALGSHFQRIGLVFNIYYTHGYFQINSENRIYFNQKNLGPPLRYGEAVSSLGLVVAFGKERDFFNPFLSPVSNQTPYAHSLGYSFNTYFNKIKTSQRTGIICLQFRNISFLSENDLFAQKSLDRFRTAAFLIQYQHRDIIQAGVNCSMWTGKMGYKTSHNDPHFYFSCYMDTIGGVYPKYSHGLLSAQIKYHGGGGQTIQANAGIDAEQVRNVVQNKLIHDMVFLPKKIRKANNCHIPMLDENGNQYLYREGQKIRKVVPYYNVFSNSSLFY